MARPGLLPPCDVLAGMVRTLQENLPIFAQQLSIPDVYQSFSEILTNAKKNAKPDALPHLEEFEAKIMEVRGGRMLPLESPLFSDFLVPPEGRRR